MGSEYRTRPLYGLPIKFSPEDYGKMIDEHGRLVPVPPPTPSAVIEPITITENGTYEPPTGVDGYAPVAVNIHSAVIESITITDNGTYNLPEGVDGYGPIVVNVPPGYTHARATAIYDELDIDVVTEAYQVTE